MRKPIFSIASLVLAAAGALAAGQDVPEQAPAKAPEPLFVRLSVYPPASLSRYDYNNDVDLTEIRIYVELRRGSQEGPAVPDAVITALGQKLDYLRDYYEKRISLDRDKRPAEVEIEIAAKGRPPIKERFPVPAWLDLTAPRPAVVDPGQDLTVRWAYDHYSAPVDINAYDFRTGRVFFQRNHLEQLSVIIPASDIPPSTIVRIYVIQSWLYKRFLSGPDYARGSEVNVIPWSQVFVRTKEPGQGGAR